MPFFLNRPTEGGQAMRNSLLVLFMVYLDDLLQLDKRLAAITGDVTKDQRAWNVATNFLICVMSVLGHQAAFFFFVWYISF